MPPDLTNPPHFSVAVVVNGEEMVLSKRACVNKKQKQNYFLPTNERQRLPRENQK